MYANNFNLALVLESILNVLHAFKHHGYIWRTYLGKIKGVK